MEETVPVENGDAGELPLVKSEPAIDELNSKHSHDALAGDAPAEAPIVEPLRADPQATPADEGQGAPEQVDAEELSEVIAQVVLEDEGANPNISEEEPAVEDSVPVVEKPESSEDAREVAYSVVHENEEVLPEASGEESNGKVDGEEGEGVVEGGSSAALREEELAEVDAVAAPSDGVEVNSEDASEVISTLEGAGKEEAISKFDGEESAEKVDGEESTEMVDGEESAKEADGEESAKEADGEELADQKVDGEESAEKVDGEESAEKVDGEESAEKVDGEELAEKVDVDESAQEESAEKVDVEELAQEESAKEVDVEESVEEVDGEESSEKVDGQQLAEMVDDKESAEKVEAEESAQEESAEKVDVEEPAKEVDSEESADQKVDGEELAEKVDVEESSAKEVDGEELSEKVVGEESAEMVDVEVSTEKVDGEVLDAPVEEDVAAPASTQAVEESESLEAVPAPSDDVEEKSVEVDSGDLSEVAAEVPSESGENEDAEPEVPVEESAEDVDREEPDVPVEEVVEASPNAEPVEEVSSLESVSTPPDDVEEKSVEVSSEDASEMPTTPESAVNEDASPEIPVDSKAIDALSEEVEEAANTTEHGEVTVELEAVPFPSNDIEDKALEATAPPPSDGADNVDSEALDLAHVDADEAVEAATPAELAEESAGLESMSAPSDDVQDRSVEMNFEDAGKAFDAPVEELSEATSAMAGDEEPAIVESVPASSDDAQSTSEEAKPEVEATSSPLPADEELFDLSESLMSRYEQIEVSDEAPAENGADHTSRELSDFAMSADVPENSQGLSREAPSYASGSADEGVAQTDRDSQVEGLPQESEAEPESTSRGVSVDAEATAEEKEAMDEGDVAQSESLSVAIEGASEDPSDAVAEPCDKDPLTEELEHPTAHASSIPSIIGVEAREFPSIESTHDDDDDDDDDGLAANVAPKSVEDVSHLLQSEMTDQEVKLAAFYDDLEECAGAETDKVESFLSVGDAQVNEFESVSRGFNLDDFISEAPTTSGEVAVGSSDESHGKVAAPYLATALATVSSEKNDGPLKSSYRHPDLDEVAANLHDAAEKALENAKASDAGERQSSVAQSVAQIVLDESSKAGDSSEYIAGVVQHVAQYAQDASKANPSALPDTVSRVFVSDTAETPADPNQVSQPKERASLGTMVSLFVVWCVSLCTSRISSKDMPAPALKLAAEEVATVLHSNAPSPPAPAQETATSSH